MSVNLSSVRKSSANERPVTPFSQSADQRSIELTTSGQPRQMGQILAGSPTETPTQPSTIPNPTKTPKITPPPRTPLPNLPGPQTNPTSPKSPTDPCAPD